MVIRKFVVFDSSFVEHNCLKLYYGDFYAVILCCWKSSPLFPKVVAFFCENTWKCWWHHNKTSQNLFNPPKSQDILISWYLNYCSSVKWFEPYLTYLWAVLCFCGPWLYRDRPYNKNHTFWLSSFCDTHVSRLCFIICDTMFVNKRILRHCS